MFYEMFKLIKIFILCYLKQCLYISGCVKFKSEKKQIDKQYLLVLGISQITLKITRSSGKKNFCYFTLSKMKKTKLLHILIDQSQILIFILQKKKFKASHKKFI